MGDEMTVMATERRSRTDHDYGREERETEDGTQYRMRCSCGKRSRWSFTTRPVMTAQDKHADDVARGR